jgi:hypothetical protein
MTYQKGRKKKRKQEGKCKNKKKNLNNERGQVSSSVSQSKLWVRAKC